MFKILDYSTEISVLLLAIVLGLLHIGLQGLVSDFERGLKWAFGSRDESKPLSPFGARLERASENFQETFPFMAAMLLIIEITDKSNEFTRNLALLWLVARVFYLPSYAFAWPIRSWLWILAIIAMSALGISLFI